MQSPVLSNKVTPIGNVSMITTRTTRRACTDHEYHSHIDGKLYKRIAKSGQHVWHKEPGGAGFFSLQLLGNGGSLIVILGNLLEMLDIYRSFPI